MPPINRKNLRRCIACGYYRPLEQMVKRTLKAGNHQFHLCLECWRKDATPPLCPDCKQPLTLANTELRKMPDGGWRVQSTHCRDCTNKRERRNRVYARLTNKYPGIVK